MAIDAHLELGSPSSVTAAHWKRKIENAFILLALRNAAACELQSLIKHSLFSLYHHKYYHKFAENIVIL